jgi:hypothetical protein
MPYDREQFNLVPKPSSCLATKGCDGTKFKEVVMEAGELIFCFKEYKQLSNEHEQ